MQACIVWLASRLPNIVAGSFGMPLIVIMFIIMLMVLALL